MIAEAKFLIIQKNLVRQEKVLITIAFRSKVSIHTINIAKISKDLLTILKT